MWRLLDLFSGIGGFSLAAQWCWGDELEIVAFCEIDKFCQKVLKKHWPDVPIIEDVRDVTIQNSFNSTNGGQETKGGQAINWNTCTTSPEGYIDLITGGFPCQPASCAGKRKGTGDNRWLWPEMLRVIQEFHPRWVLAENVLGLLSLEGGVVVEHRFSDLESAGYEVQPLIIPACGQNAPHRRDRAWIVAYNSQQNDGFYTTRKNKRQVQQSGKRNFSENVADKHNTGLSPQWKQGRIREEEGAARTGTERTGLLGGEWASNGWHSQPDMGGMANGIPRRVDGYFDREPYIPRVAKGVPDRVNRLKALGNSIMPQVAYQIFKAIKTVEKNQKL